MSRKSAAKSEVTNGEESSPSWRRRSSAKGSLFLVLDENHTGGGYPVAFEALIAGAFERESRPLVGASGVLVTVADITRGRIPYSVRTTLNVHVETGRALL